MDQSCPVGLLDHARVSDATEQPLHTDNRSREAQIRVVTTFGEEIAARPQVYLGSIP